MFCPTRPKTFFTLFKHPPGGKVNKDSLDFKGSQSATKVEEEKIRFEWKVTG
jgi:hypothetical protein